MEYGWRLNREAWENLVSVCKGLVWRSVPFVEVHEKLVPERPGVYLICARPPVDLGDYHQDFFNVLYVGRSQTSIRSRFKSHCVNPGTGIKQVMQAYGCNNVDMQYYYAVAPRESVAEIEDRLIDCYGPRANMQAGDKIYARICTEQERPAGGQKVEDQE